MRLTLQLKEWLTDQKNGDAVLTRKTPVGKLIIDYLKQHSVTQH
jgi:hypothetical protein